MSITFIRAPSVDCLDAASCLDQVGGCIAPYQRPAQTTTEMGEMQSAACTFGCLSDLPVIYYDLIRFQRYQFVFLLANRLGPGWPVG